MLFRGPWPKAQIQDVKFGDWNGDGLEDISITATSGFFEWNQRRLEQFYAAQEPDAAEYANSTAMKIYTIELLFDGNSYKLTPKSRAPAALFPAR